MVTYDPRGVSDSPLDGPPRDVTVETFADDARRLIEAVGPDPAFVVGESGGAVVGLALVAIRAVVETLHRDGVGPAMGAFLAAVGFDPDAPAPEPRPSVIGNLGFFLEHLMLETVDRYTPDVATLRSRPVTVTVGEDSVGQLLYRTAVALAERLGPAAVSLPGNHFGIQTHPTEFAARLRAILR